MTMLTSSKEMRKKIHRTAILTVLQIPPPSQKPMTRAQKSTNRNLNHLAAPLNARCQRFLQICIGPAQLYYNEFSSMLSPSAQKNPWSNTIKADDHRTIYLTHITFNNIPSSPNAKKLALTKLCYVFCFKGSDEMWCMIPYINTAMYIWLHRWTMQCVHDSVYQQCDAWSPYWCMISICAWIYMYMNS